ncbi:hypothetical protein BJ322DRAFT_836282 [Thelephora terrestris]|uniref:Uncharacterized protein n=1 Tax=Thelephora terrestris TaxID=56493 RepID=A0A9P6HEH8_9AGAM|nr:hypothetical protein BJ322DRAFT_836282 [Thelephora terrestris]
MATIRRMRSGGFCLHLLYPPSNANRASPHHSSVSTDAASFLVIILINPACQKIPRSQGSTLASRPPSLTTQRNMSVSSVSSLNERSISASSHLINTTLFLLGTNTTFASGVFNCAFRLCNPVRERQRAGMINWRRNPCISRILLCMRHCPNFYNTGQRWCQKLNRM